MTNPTAIRLYHDEIEELRRDGVAILYRYKNPTYDVGRVFYGPFAIRVERVESYEDWQTIVVRSCESANPKTDPVH